MATCHHCGQTFANVLQLGAHIRTHRAEDDDEHQNPDDGIADNVITAPAPLFELARRPPGSWGNEEVQIQEVQISAETTFARDYREVCFVFMDMLGLIFLIPNYI